MWTSGLLEINETLVIQQTGVRLYDGDDKVSNFTQTSEQLVSLQWHWPNSKLHACLYECTTKGSKQSFLCSV